MIAITLILILSFLHAGTQGSPLPLPPSPHSQSQIINTPPRDDSANGIGNGDRRTTYGIVWSCLVTISACVWSAGHPNISGPTDSGWAVLKRRIIAMAYVLIAPELVACWALRQYVAAKRIASDYNMTFVDEGEDTVYTQSSWGCVKHFFQESLCGGVAEWFAERPRSVSRRGKGLRWTQTHGFFVQMGGFLLYEDDYPSRVLSYDDMKTLIATNEIEPPILAEADLKDRSKGDAISKGFVVLQTTWFAVQCLARLAKRLPLAEVEVVTLGFTVLNAIMYAVWWNKPQGVGTAICVHLQAKSSFQKNIELARDQINSGVDESVDEPGVQVEAPSESVSEGCSGAQTPDVITLSNPDIQVDEEKNPYIKEGWLQHRLAKDRSKFRSLPYIFVRVPWRCMQCLVRPLKKLCGDSFIPSGALRVPIFYVDNRGGDQIVWIMACIIGTGFGAVHLLAWTSKFPTMEESLLWRISALIITVAPALVFVGSIIEKCNFKHSQVYKGVQPTFTLIAVPLYVCARCSLIVLAVLALRKQPRQVYIPVPWTSFIPHF